MATTLDDHAKLLDTILTAAAQDPSQHQNHSAQGSAGHIEVPPVVSAMLASPGGAAAVALKRAKLARKTG